MGRDGIGQGGAEQDRCYMIFHKIAQNISEILDIFSVISEMKQSSCSCSC